MDCGKCYYLLHSQMYFFPHWCLSVKYFQPYVSLIQTHKWCLFVQMLCWFTLTFIRDLNYTKIVYIGPCFYEKEMPEVKLNQFPLMQHDLLQNEEALGITAFNSFDNALVSMYSRFSTATLLLALASGFINHLAKSVVWDIKKINIETPDSTLFRNRANWGTSIFVTTLLLQCILKVMTRYKVHIA